MRTPLARLAARHGLCFCLTLSVCVQNAAADEPTGEQMLAPVHPSLHETPAHSPQIVADLAFDVGADTFLFRRPQTAFALELAPRLGLMFADSIDLGLVLIAGYGSATKSWNQTTMFGIGPYVGVRLPINDRWRLMPWVSVDYHQTFMDGFSGEPLVDGDPDVRLIGTRQIIRVDVHADAVYRPQGRTAFTAGLFCKTRVASFDHDLGQSPEVAYGIRLGAASYF